MTTHEMILLCSSLQGVSRCIPLGMWKIGLRPGGVTAVA